MSKTSIGDYSLNDLKVLAPHIPGIGNFINRLLADSYEDFIEALRIDIDEIVSKLQENPELLSEDGEDRLTSEIKRSLTHMGYKATHDEKIGGHSDLAVRGQKNYLWIGEAKIHSSYDYLYQGFQQLTTRYSTGDVNQDQGGMLIYIRNRDANAVVTNWRQHLRDKTLDSFEESDCKHRPNFAFITKHNHSRSGTPFTVRHIGVILGFDPQDRR